MSLFIAQLFLNQSAQNRFLGYEDGDLMKRGYMHPTWMNLQLRLNLTADTLEDAADMAFQEWSKDSRLNGRYERSMSIGDVVRLFRWENDRESEPTYLVCDTQGWTKIDPTKMVIEGKVDSRVCCEYAERLFCVCEICYTCLKCNIGRACIGSHD